MPRGPKPLRRNLRSDEFYCVGCRAAVKSGTDIKYKEYSSSKRNKIPMIKGKCKKCEGGVNKIVKNSAAKSMKQRYA